MRKENSYYTMNHTVEDLSLFNALRQGDGNSFDHLFRKYYPMLCAYAHRLVSLEDAEEIVQEVMLWLWENRGDLIIESSLNQYLFKMTYRRVLNHLTREQVKTKAEAAFYERTQAALCEVDYARFEELDRKIKEAMAALPDSYREAYPEHWEAVTANKEKNISSSSSFFPTMLDLGGIKTPYRDDSQSVATPLYKMRPRVYLNDHNEPRPLDDLGMKKQDFHMLEKQEINT